MFASPNITFFSFIRRLTHSIFQFGLRFFFFFSCGTLAQITQHTKHLPRLDTQRGIAQHGGEPRPIFSPSFYPQEFFCTETLVPEFVWQLSISPPSMGDSCFLTLQASEHGTVNSFSPAWSMPSAPARLPALVPVCKAASHSYCCSLCSWTWCFPPPGPARRGMRQDVWSAWRSGWTAPGPTFRAASPSASHPGNTKWHRVVLLLIRCGQTWLEHKCKSSSFFSCL